MASFFGGGKNKGGGAGSGGAEPPKFSGSVGDPTPDEALERLKEGNRAFVSGEGVLTRITALDLDETLQTGQKPFAVVVGCADSRAPPTLLFNQGLGRLFIIRVAGNTVDRRGLASIVYAIKHLKTPLIVVLGHTGCGAVGAAVSVVEGRSELDPSLEEMITPIIPAVLHVKARGEKEISNASVAENARRVAEGLKTADTHIADALKAGKLKIVAAVKDLRTGEVQFLS